MKRFASIDIGTNSVLLLATEYQNGGLSILDDLATTTRLGNGLTEEGLLSAAGMDNTMRALEKYLKVLNLRGISDVYSFGTAAFRDARNADSFRLRIKKELGFDLRILSQKEEALLTFLGALDTMPELNCPMVVVDVGGGSSEVIYGVSDDVSFWRSFPVGAINIRDKFDIKDSISDSLRKEIEEFLFGEFRQIPPYLSSSFFLGTGGTATTLAAVSLKLDRYNHSKIDGFSLGVNRLQDLYDELNRMTRDERAKLPGMEAGRADIILPATLILMALMTHMAIFQLKVSTRGTRYGILVSELRQIDVEAIS